MADPDKKVEKVKKMRSEVYQSSQHPEHFQNEGSEYINSDPRTEPEEDEDVRNMKKTPVPKDISERKS